MTVTLGAQQRDVVEFSPVDPTSCCFDMMLINEHSPNSSLDRLRLVIVTPGIHFQPDANGPWPENFEDETVLVFGQTGDELPSSESLEGFSICFERFSGSPTTFRIAWTTEFEGQVINTDTIELQCAPIFSFCDSVAVVPYAPSIQPEGSCCYEFSLHNLHQPEEAIDGLDIRLFNAGAEIIGIQNAPWPVDAQTETLVSFRADMDSLASGRSLGEFRVCISPPNGVAGPVQFLWTSFKNGRPICEGILFAECVFVVQPRCDSLFMNKTQDCDYTFGFRNLHKPESALNSVQMNVLTAGAALDTVSAPAGWSIQSQSALNVRFDITGSPLPTGDLAEGFALRFKPSASGLFDVAMCTMLDDAMVCCDTFQIQCDPPPPTYCDSLLIDAVPNTCTYDFGFANTHQPVSAVNDFHIRLQTEGASIADAVAPGNWFIVSNDGKNIVFRDTTDVVLPDQEQTGFRLSLDPGDASGRIIFEWCTSLDAVINCCDVGSVLCDPPTERCDSLFSTPTVDYCSYALGFTNLHVPVSSIDGFSVTLDNPETMLLGADAPVGWSVDSMTETSVRYIVLGSAVSTGITVDQFILHLLPSFGNSRIPLTFCTTSSGATVCCDTLSVFCEVKIAQCDVIDVITNVDEPCCFEFEVQNTHLPRSVIDAFNVEILTAGVSFYNSTVRDAEGWKNFTNSRRVGWRQQNGALLSGETLGGFSVCYDNDVNGNADFQIVVQTVSSGLILCQDTLTIKCDRTLGTHAIEGVLPERFMLHQNYPNPFNSATTIEFDVPAPSDVTLTLYDSHGRLVMDLGSGSYLAGRYRISLDASQLTSGIYFYQLRTVEYTKTRTMLLLQ
jgi:hypothetical protein